MVVRRTEDLFLPLWGQRPACMGKALPATCLHGYGAGVTCLYEQGTVSSSESDAWTRADLQYAWRLSPAAFHVSYGGAWM